MSTPLIGFSGGPIKEFVDREVAAELANARGDIADAIKLREHPQILPHREAMRHVDIGAFEIHPRKRAIAIARHIDAEHMNGA